MDRHTFVICAYKESPFLEECIMSLKKQSVKSKIIMISSTPNAYIKQIAEKNEIPLYINEGKSGITQDWNFGYAKAASEYVTIAHQDDIYKEDYLKDAFERVSNAKHPLIYFCNYNELRNGNIVKHNILLHVKRLMLLPLRIKLLQKSIWVRRRILSFGSPVCCPSVFYVKKNLPDIIFKNGFRSCEDWEAWEKLSALKGEFLYSSKPLVLHRIHEGSETSAIIESNGRSAEEYEMYLKFWPAWFAKIIVKPYAKGQKSNKL